MSHSQLYRSIDPETSVEAAQSVEPNLTELQKKVYYFIKSKGMVTDSQIVEFGAMHGYAESTLRKRRSELSAIGALEFCGTRKNARGRKEGVWQVKP